MVVSLCLDSATFFSRIDRPAEDRRSQGVRHEVYRCCVGIVVVEAGIFCIEMSSSFPTPCQVTNTVQEHMYTCTYVRISTE